MTCNSVTKAHKLLVIILADLITICFRRWRGPSRSQI